MTPSKTVVKTTDVYAHQKRYNQKMLHSGLRRVTVWVPNDRVDDITQAAVKYRSEADAA